MSYFTFLLLPHIKIHNANALSSPYTIGFPAMTAWLGAVHALQRKLQANGWSAVTCQGAGVICHHMELQTYRGQSDYVSSIIGTGNPLKENGERSSFIEEARCHLDVSLVIQVTGVKVDNKSYFCEQVVDQLGGSMKIAGGDIVGFSAPEIMRIEAGNDQDMTKLHRKLMPGYALIERRDLMKEAMEQGQDALEALLDYLAVHHRCEQNEKGEVIWSRQRKRPPVNTGVPPCSAGWIVPVATGFQGITPLAETRNQRDAETPHRFAESVVTLGEFKMPYRLRDLNELLWHYRHNETDNLYLCEQSNGDSDFSKYY